jgi:uncharacterized protein involved in outer membrane biogenesis
VGVKSKKTKMKLRPFKLILALFIGLLLLAAIAVTALFLVNPAVFRNQLQAGAAAAFGRQVQFGGSISLKPSLRPRIVIEDITIGNPDWTAEPYLAQAEKVDVQVALLPLLLGDLRVLEVSFTGVDLFLEQGPDDIDNYTFGDSQESAVLPAVDRLVVRDAVIYYRSTDAGIRRYEIAEARLLNIPGQPERIEGNGSTKGMSFTFRVAADIAAELSSPQNPWSMKLDIQGPDMSLVIDGRMPEAFIWDRVDYHINLSGKQADSLEALFDMEFPTSGPFELSADVNTTAGSYTLSNLVARVQGLPNMPVIRVSQGEASGGQDNPIHFALQGKYGDAPFAFEFESENPLSSFSQNTLWPMEAWLNIADTKLDLQGAMSPGTAAVNFELDVRLQGKTLNTLARVLGTGLPKTGPYQFSFHTRIAEEGYNITRLKGFINEAALWDKIRIVRGEASVLESGSIGVSVQGELAGTPLTLSFLGGPEKPGESGATNWPVKLEASLPGAALNGEGTVVTTGDRKVLQIATRVKGERLDSLGSLVGVSLPNLGTYDASALLSSGGGVHELSNFKVQMGANRLTGNVRWENKTPRPLLTGKLSSETLTLAELLDTAIKPSSKTVTTGLFDRPMALDWLKELDIKLELNVDRVADGRIPVEEFRSTVTLENGSLSAPISGKLAGVPVDGQIKLTNSKNIPGVSLKAAIGKFDVGQTLKRLELAGNITGSVDAVHLDGSSQGKTLHALLEQAALTLQIKPANLHYKGDVAGQMADVTFNSVELSASKGRPVTGTFVGILHRVPFNATVSAGNLINLYSADTPLPVNVALQTADVQFKAEGTIARPLDRKEFDLKHELQGKEVSGIDPLFDFTVPLRGAFLLKGRVTGDGSRFTYEENLRVGKSDLKWVITVLPGPERPHIAGSVVTKELHLDDIRLFEVDEDTEPHKSKSRLIPQYTIPVDLFLTADLDLDIKVEHIRAKRGDFGNLVSKVNLKDGRFKSSMSVTGSKGAQLSSVFDLNSVADPPTTRIQLTGKDLNFGLLLTQMELTDLVEGRIDLYVDLFGSGATRRTFLENAAGQITVIGGPGKISGKKLELWAADLVATMFSPKWQSQKVTDMNCMVAHIKLQEGLAELGDFMLDTQRITIAGSGKLDLGTEELNVFIAPKPKRASLVSLANPVKIKGTLSQPEVSVAKLPKKGRLTGAGILAGLVNPAFLIFAFSDVGTGEANPCVSAVKRAQEAVEAGSQ